MRGEARNPRVELRVGKFPLTAKIDQRRLVRRAAAEMRDPLVIANRQALLQIGGLMTPLARSAVHAGQLAQLRPDWLVGRFGAGRLEPSSWDAARAALSCVEWLRHGLIGRWPAGPTQASHSTQGASGESRHPAKTLTKFWT